MRRSPSTRTTVLVASSGGHVEELRLLAPRLLPPLGSHHWMTFDTPQTRALLGDDPVTFLHPSGPRDASGLARSTPTIARKMVDLRPAAVVSTGAAVAVPALALARILGADLTYIESAARTAGPSLTGRILERLPGVRLLTQWPEWASARWAYEGCVFDGFRSITTEPGAVRSIFVTLGTQKSHRFGRLLESLHRLVRPDTQVFVQHGSTPLPPGLPGAAFLAPAELTRRLRESDAVVAHAGVGTALGALRCGRLPLLVPREAAHGEHIDDHQAQIADRLAAMDLAVARRVEELTIDDIVASASRKVVEAVAPDLQPPGRRPAGDGQLHRRLPQS